MFVKKKLAMNNPKGRGGTRGRQVGAQAWQNI